MNKSERPVYKSFKDELTLEQRKKESNSILEKHPNTIPIIVEQLSTSKLKAFDKKKYLVLNTFKIYHVISVIRKRMKLNKNDALYLFVNGRELLKNDALVTEIYEKYKDEDGFLYMNYSEYNSFGGQKL